MKAIILDRDGVINFDSDDYIKSPAEWQAIPGSLEAIAKLTQAGYSVFIATNQSGLARKFFDLATLSAIHAKLLAQVTTAGGHIQDIFFCPHHPDDACPCRKPKSGLLEKIEKKYNLDLKNAYFIGDNISDIHAALAHGCKPILVKTGKGERTLQANPNLNVSVYTDLSAAIDAILLFPISENAS